MAQPARETLLPIRHNVSRPRKRLDPFVAISNPALRRAAARVGERWHNNSAGLVSEQDVTFELLALGRAIESPQSQAIEASADSATIVLRGGLLHELQSEVLKEWADSDQIASEEMLAILSGFNRVHASIEPSSADGLARRLSDPGGL
jgi:hypothetical protein